MDVNWVAHLIFGLLLGLVAFYFLTPNPYEIVLFGIFAGASALLPDLDHAGSKARELLDKAIIFVAFAFTYLFYCQDFSCMISENFVLRIFAFAGVYFIIFTYFRPEHRGITHSLLFMVFFAALIYFVLGWKFALAGALGYLSHLILDMSIKII